MWKTSCSRTGPSFLRALSHYRRNLALLERRIAAGDAGGLLEYFGRAKKTRDGLLSSMSGKTVVRGSFPSRRQVDQPPRRDVRRARDGTSRVRGFLHAADTLSTAGMMRALGARIEEVSPTELRIEGRGCAPCPSPPT